MPSLDPARLNESAEDCALREELRQLLGAPAADLFEVEVTPEMIALADDLRREATRRRRMAPRQRPGWMLLAAALPLALVFAGLASWGVQQKHRADAMAEAVVQREQALQLANAQVRQQTLLLASTSTDRTPRSQKPGAPGSKPAELVIPVDGPVLPPQADTTTVKVH